MELYPVIVDIAKEAGIPVTKIGTALGKNRSYLSSVAAHGRSPRCNTLAKILRVCGYELVAVPEDSVPEGAYIIGD